MKRVFIFTVRVLETKRLKLNFKNDKGFGTQAVVHNFNLGTKSNLIRIKTTLTEKEIMTHKNFITYPFWILLLILTLTSCGSKKRVALPADFKGPKELSRLYGVRITPDDNIFLYNEGAKWLGTPHRMGGSTKRGVDCSGFVAIVFREIYGKQLSRSSADMLKYNCKKVSRAKLQEGDLVFFRTGRGKKKVPNHVGIYLKNGKFIHTSTSKGVIVSSLSEPYYTRSWITGGRVK